MLRTKQVDPSGLVAVIPGALSRQILHFGPELLTTVGVSNTDVRFVMRLLLTGFEAQNLLFGTEPVKACGWLIRAAQVCITNYCLQV